MKNLKKILLKYGKAFATLALYVNVMAIGGTCRYFFYEPEIPSELMEHKRKRKNLVQ